MYSKLADFLNDNIHRIRQLVDNQDHKRIFVLDLLLPEVNICEILPLTCFLCVAFYKFQALSYGVQKAFNVPAKEAFEIVVYGIKKKQVPPSL